MPSRNLKVSSARPSQPPAEGRADDASSLTSNTVAHFAGVFGVQASCFALFGRLLSFKRRELGRRQGGETFVAVQPTDLRVGVHTTGKHTPSFAPMRRARILIL